MIYGASLTLEFVALICLRIREPELKRPFRVPGGCLERLPSAFLPCCCWDLPSSAANMKWCWG
jgi:hypothetical protein